MTVLSLCVIYQCNLFELPAKLFMWYGVISRVIHMLQCFLKVVRFHTCSHKFNISYVSRELTLYQYAQVTRCLSVYHASVFQNCHYNLLFLFPFSFVLFLSVLYSFQWPLGCISQL